MDNYQPIFDYIDEQLKELPTKAELESQTNRVLNAISAFRKQTQNNTEEIAAAHNRIDGVDSWIVKVAEKTNTLYNP